jgi:phosphoglucosamine mutase
MQERGKLARDTVVGTVMSNLGFKLAMRDSGITLIETGVGDRYVLEAMRANGYNLGGEQSGHVVLLDYATTGDGTLTALHLLARMADTGRSLADLASVMTKLPQVLINVRGVDRAAVGTSSGLAAAVESAQRGLGETGRVLLRPSGTEPVVRVMVEAPSDTQARAVAAELAAVVAREIPLP